MADCFDKATRSRIMAAVRQQDTKPELALRAALQRAGAQLQAAPPWSPSRADIWLAPGVAVFVDGDYWHSCPLHGKPPDDAGWQAKLAENVIRDRRNERDMLRAGVVPVRAWECEVLRRPDRVALEIAGLSAALSCGRVCISDLAWAGGLIDGEGTITIMRGSGSGPGGAPVLSVGMAHTDCLEHLAAMFGFGKVRQWSSSRSHMYKWATVGSFRVGTACRWLKCFLRLKRPQAELVLAWCATVQVDKVRRSVTKAERSDRDEILMAVRSLNARGRGLEWRNKLSASARRAWEIRPRSVSGPSGDTMMPQGRLFL